MQGVDPSLGHSPDHLFLPSARARAIGVQLATKEEVLRILFLSRNCFVLIGSQPVSAIPQNSGQFSMAASMQQYVG